jgi:hypothetical protein
MCVVHVVNYNMSKFGFKILKLLNLKWKIASNITSLVLISGHCTQPYSKIEKIYLIYLCLEFKHSTINAKVGVSRFGHIN